jgi:Ca-activated chloride channel family protein
MNVKVRYKKPDGNSSMLVEHPVMDKGGSIQGASDNLKFAAAVAEMGMLLRNSPYKGSSSYAGVLSLAGQPLSNDNEGYRKEFLTLVKKAEAISKKTVAKADVD